MASRSSWDHKFEIAPGKWVHVPDDNTKAVGYEIAALVREKWSPPHNYYHLRKGGHVSALKSHLDHKYFARADIHNFFGQINRNRVLRHLKRLVGNYEQAKEYASLSVVPNPNGDGFVLPFGFPQSTVLASLCLSNSKLGKLIANAPEGVKVSVYVDDIVLSTAYDEALLSSFFSDLLHAAERSAFPFGSKKLMVPSDTIEAFNIELKENHLVLTSARFNQFRDKIVSEKGIEENARQGVISYVDSINIDQAHSLSSFPFTPSKS